MDHARRLVETSASADPGACHGCAAPHGSLPPLIVHEFDERAFVRCSHCGDRYSCSSSAEPIHDCADCGVPFLPAPDEPLRCAHCVEPPARSLPLLSEMTVPVESEWLAGLSDGWEFVTSAAAQRYLERLHRTTLHALGDSPRGGRVLIVRQSAVRSLAFPGGTVCLSTGLLDSVGDEAELVFLLAHELAHSASDAWPRHAMRGLAAAGDVTERRQRWLACAEDLMRVGHGDRKEFEADRMALNATLGLGYDGNAPLRWLQRIERRVVAADPDVAEFVLAHPPVHARTNRVESERNLRRSSSSGPGALCNRSLFRRVLGHSAIRSELQPLSVDEFKRAAVPARRSVWRGAMAGLLVLAAAALVVWLLTTFWN